MKAAIAAAAALANISITELLFAFTAILRCQPTGNIPCGQAGMDAHQKKAADPFGTAADSIRGPQPSLQSHPSITSFPVRLRDRIGLMPAYILYLLSITLESYSIAVSIFSMRDPPSRTGDCVLFDYIDSFSLQDFSLVAYFAYLRIVGGA
jgi:hypothetical protein